MKQEYNWHIGSIAGWNIIKTFIGFGGHAGAGGTGPHLGPGGLQHGGANPVRTGRDDRQFLCSHHDCVGTADAFWRHCSGSWGLICMMYKKSGRIFRYWGVR